MEIGTEISQKIRSAIKAKLVELGAYVDEELPDYIMVMVANKKSQMQMRDDLNLFLGLSTEKFTLWLQNLLNKLQSITADSAVKKDIVPEAKVEPTLSTGPPMAAPVTAAVPISAVTASLSTNTVVANATVAKTTAATIPVVKIMATKSTPREMVTPVVAIKEDDNEESFQFQVDTDEFNEEFIKESVHVPAASKKIAKAPVYQAMPVESRVSSKSLPKSRERKRSDKSDETGHTHHRASRIISSPIKPSIKMVTKEPSSSLGKRKAPHSVIGTILRQFTDEDEEEYNPLNPAVGRVASIIRVSERKSSIPRALQANKSLLLKAVCEAEKSVANRKAEIVVTHRAMVRPIQRISKVQAVRTNKKSGIELLSKSKRQDILRSMKYNIDNEASEEEETTLVLTDSHLPQLQGAEGESNSESGDVSSEKEHLVDKRLIECQDSPDQESIEPENMTAEDSQPVLEVDSDEYEQLVSNGSEIEEMMTAEDMEKRIVQEQSALKEPVSNQKFIVTLDGVDERYEQRVREEQLLDAIDQEYAAEEQPIKMPQNVSARLKLPKVQKISINLTESDQDSDEENIPQTKKQKPAERCKFWPACANGNACTYHHPTVSCTTFPNCKFGDRCLYIHPNCMFDASCTRSDCPYTHASKRMPSYPIPPQKSPVLQPVIVASKPATCKFYPNCRNMTCSFAHPKPCRFGASCKNKPLCSFYHPPIPSKEQLTWTSYKK